MYFDEDHLLEIRLNTLHKHVKKFVIVEASLDHAGNSRTPLFDIKKFSKFKDKIHYILVKDLPSHNNLEEVIIGSETVENSKPPIMVHSDKNKDVGAQV